MDAVKYKRVMLKLSGEAISKKNPDGSFTEIFDEESIDGIAQSIKRCTDLGVGFGVMIGAGNIWRGKYGKGMNRSRADHMGMLATTINCLRMQEALIKAGMNPVTMSAISMTAFAESFNAANARAYLDELRPVIFACGIGIPYISTDTAGVVRALEIGSDVILMAKNIDGIYTADPELDKSAEKFRKISYSTCLDMDLRATDSAASAIAMEQKIDTFVFSLKEDDSIYRAITGNIDGTLVTYREIEPEKY